MALRLIVGRANVGKTGRALDLIRQAHAAGREPILVLPSQPDVRRAADELSVTDALGFRAVTFEDYLKEAWGRCGDGRAIVSGATRTLLACTAARELGLGRGMGVLAARCVTVLAGQLGDSWREVQPSATEAGDQLTRTILGYRDALDRLGLVEPEEAAFLISSSASMPGDPLVVHRFIDFTPWQECLLRGAAETGEVLVTLTWEPGFAPTEALSGLVVRLGGVVETAAHEPFHTKPELSLLANSLFSQPIPIVAGDAIRFSLAEGYEAEAHRIAEEVRLAIALGINGNGRGRETPIAVVFRQPERHYRFLREAFDEAGIDADFDVRLPLGATSFGATLLSVLGFVVSGERDLLLAVVKSPFSGVDRDVALLLEHVWRANGIASRAELVDGLWQGSKELQRIMRVAGKVSRQGIGADGACRISRVATDLFVMGYGREGTTGHVVAEDAAAHAAIQRVLSEIASIDDDSIVLSDVIETLRSSLVMKQEPERAGVVQVTAVDRVRGRRYDTVIIGGMNADEFPAAESENMQSGSAVAAVLGAFGAEETSQKGVEYEQILFYTVLTRAQNRLVLSARTADSDGDPAALSSLYEAVADFCRENGDDRPPHTFRALSQTPSRSDSATPRERLRAKALVAEGDLRSEAALWRSKSRRARLEREASLARLASTDVFSPSALDGYLECPYRWFYSRAVNGQALESQFDAREQGSFAHEVLASSYAALIANGIARVTPENVETVQSAVTQEWTRLDAELGESTTVLERSQRRATLSWALRIMQDDATFALGYAPQRMEWSFGMGDEAPIDLGGFSLRGRIDRLDVAPTGEAIVIDYKRSSGPTAANILEKRKIQVPLYLEAVRVGLGLQPVAGIYRGLQKRCDRGLLLSEAEISGAFTKTDIRPKAEFEAIIESALGLAREAVAGIRQGRIEQRPLDPASCKTCPARPVCGGAR